MIYLMGMTLIPVCLVGGPDFIQIESRMFRKATILQCGDDDFCDADISGKISGGVSVEYTYVEIETPVPAPATLALFGLGLAGLACRESRQALAQLKQYTRNAKTLLRKLC
jgi:hypothetical protein